MPLLKPWIRLTNINWKDSIFPWIFMVTDLFKLDFEGPFQSSTKIFFKDTSEKYYKDFWKTWNFCKVFIFRNSAYWKMNKVKFCVFAILIVISFAYPNLISKRDFFQAMKNQGRDCVALLTMIILALSKCR